MAAVSMLDDTNFEMDKLTSEIFSILENKFLFGYNDHSTPKEQVVVPLQEMKSGKHVTGKVRILSIDGGGATDGVLAAKSIAHLEAFLRSKSGNPNAHIADYFDVVAGSGVGGVLAGLLFTRGKDGGPMFTADEAAKFVIENGHKICRSNKRGLFRRILRSTEKGGAKVFGRTFEELTLKDTLKAVLIPCYDLMTGAPFLFSRADALELDGCDFKMSDACAATSAAGGPVEVSSIDRRTKIAAVGGEVAMNNPTAAAITHVLNNKQEFPFCNGVEDLVVVSLGNGEQPFCGGAGNMTPSRTAFVKIVGETISDTVDQAVSMAFGNSRASNYGRIQANGGFLETERQRMKGKVDILRMVDEMLAQKNVESVMFRGKKFHSTNLDKLEFFAGELIKENERRKTNILPTVLLKQTTSSSSPRTSSATTLSIQSSN